MTRNGLACSGSVSQLSSLEPRVRLGDVGSVIDHVSLVMAINDLACSGSVF